MPKPKSRPPERGDVPRPPRGIDVRLSLTGRALESDDLAKIIGAVAAAIATVIGVVATILSLS